METTRVWRHLGVVETIYEEGEDSSSSDDEHSTPPLSPDQLSPSPAPLCSRMALDSGNENDVVINVHGSSFYVNKGPLIAKSNYLKRLLKESTKELTISPPLNITPDTFSLLIDYCYGPHIVITPFNVAPLRVAAELLEMAEVNRDPAGEDLREKTESYFRRVVAVNHEYTGIVLRSCVSLMPEAESTASLVSRCIEALSLMEEEEEILHYLHDVSKLPAGSFQVLVECLNQRLTTHDLLYRLVDLYLKEHKGEITEEEKIRMCNYIDCTVVSPQLLMHAVQNPIMPLRFVVQAMFLEQLNTRRTIFTAADQHLDLKQLTTTKHKEKPNPETLGAILQRDAALRQVAQLKANMDTTRTKIQSLEKELDDMRRILKESDNIRKNTHDSGRSQSFRTISSTRINKIERDQIGSVSSASILNNNSKERGVVSERWYPSSEASPTMPWRTPRRTRPADQKNLGRRLMDGLKSTFGVSNSVSKKNKTESKDGERGEIGNGDVVVIKKDLPLHRQPRRRL